MGIAGMTAALIGAGGFPINVWNVPKKNHVRASTRYRLFGTLQSGT